MKLLVINGSPKMKTSNTEKILKPFCEGAAQSGCELRRIYLCEKDIIPCKGCLACYLKGLDECINRDDFKTVLDEFLWADLIVIAAPVYAFSLPAHLKAFIERLHFRLWTSKRVLINDNVYFIANEKILNKHKKILVILNASYDGDYVFKSVTEMCSRTFENYVDTNNETVISYLGDIKIGFGGLLSFDAAGNGSDFYTLLHNTGQELVQTGEISKETFEKVNRPLYYYMNISKEEAVRRHDEFVQKVKDKYAAMSKSVSVNDLL